MKRLILIALLTAGCGNAVDDSLRAVGAADYGYTRDRTQNCYCWWSNFEALAEK